MNHEPLFGVYPDMVPAEIFDSRPVSRRDSSVGFFGFFESGLLNTQLAGQATRECVRARATGASSRPIRLTGRKPPNSSPSLHPSIPLRSARQFGMRHLAVHRASRRGSGCFDHASLGGNRLNGVDQVAAVAKWRLPSVQGHLCSPLFLESEDSAVPVQQAQALRFHP